MHPGIQARRRAEAEARLDNALAVLAERAGVAPTRAGHPPTRDGNLRALFALEEMADIAERLAGVEPLAGTATDPATVLTVDDLIAARVREAASVTDEELAAIVAEATRTDTEEPLEERLLAIKGVGPKTVAAVLPAITGAGVEAPLPPPEPAGKARG